MRIGLWLIPLLLASASAHAQTQRIITYKLSTGTGFVINREGHIVTNAHVLKECRSISILTPRGEESASELASDEDLDLAVLKTGYNPPAIAPMRWNIDELKVGDEVTVMGFPGQRGVNGQALTKKTRLVNLKGPSGEDRWLQLRSIAAQGNSGGPVLDSSGNVIAVITGMAQIYRQDKTGNPVGRMLRQTDYAITLPALRDFLQTHRINTYESVSGAIGYNYTRAHGTARDFIVPVRCVQSEEVQELPSRN